MLYIIIPFLVALIVAAYWHIKQNRELAANWRQHFDATTAQWLEQFAWTRTAQLLIAIACGLFALLVLNHLHTKAQNEQLTTITGAMDSRLQQLTQLQQQMDTISAQLAEQRQQAAYPSPSGDVSVNARIVPENQVRPTDVITDEALGARIEAQAQPISLQDVYNPEMGATDDLSEMDAIKKRYEGLLINYLFLKKCGMINPQDYHTIISALAREMASVNAPGRLEHDITTAAQGSFNEMYAQSSCEGDEIKQLQTQYSDYIKTISQNLPTLQ